LAELNQCRIAAERKRELTANCHNPTADDFKIAAIPCSRHKRPSRATMTSPSASNDPLHGITLETILTRLVAHFGWAELGRRIEIRCFNYDPSIKSSLQFLRRTPWARTKVEQLYVRHVADLTRS
jgi:hypothetical protein